MDASEGSTASRGGVKKATGGILIVDDDLDLLFIVRRILENKGLGRVWCESSGKKALARLAESEIPVMITDYNMPGMDGLELTRRARVVSPHLAVLMMTAEPTPAVIRGASDAGIVQVIEKTQVLDILTVLRDHGLVTGPSCGLRRSHPRP